MLFYRFQTIGRVKVLEDKARQEGTALPASYVSEKHKCVRSHNSQSPQTTGAANLSATVRQGDAAATFRSLGSPRKSFGRKKRKTYLKNSPWTWSLSVKLHGLQECPGLWFSNAVDPVKTSWTVAIGDKKTWHDPSSRGRESTENIHVWQDNLSLDQERKFKMGKAMCSPIPTSWLTQSGPLPTTLSSLYPTSM